MSGSQIIQQTSTLKSCIFLLNYWIPHGMIFKAPSVMDLHGPLSHGSPVVSEETQAAVSGWGGMGATNPILPLLDHHPACQTPATLPTGPYQLRVIESNSSTSGWDWMDGWMDGEVKSTLQAGSHLRQSSISVKQPTCCSLRSPEELSFKKRGNQTKELVGCSMDWMVAPLISNLSKSPFSN